MQARYLIISTLLIAFMLTTSSVVFSFTTSTDSNVSLRHLIFIVQENHSFDNYFGTYPGADGVSNISIPFNVNNLAMGSILPFHLNPNVNVSIVGDELPAGISDPEELAATTATTADSTAPFHLYSESPTDMSHAWTVAHQAYDNGKMDGFVTAENNTQTMGYYDRQDIPYYWDYADHYVLDDNFFSSQMGPSFPNHLYIASGAAGPTNMTNFWVLNNSIVDNPAMLPPPNLPYTFQFLKALI